ncbi:hypothetical protein SBA4_790013 [Candidatus Sulfopaludibacter sp. SbA4]|nr:hypothetical protein SBA4_790013 [Candidatus Sulfopaludibacter sp. SbA4]
MAQERSMAALFADTFYWIALAAFNDSAHQRAPAIVEMPNRGPRLRLTAAGKGWPTLRMHLSGAWFSRGRTDGTNRSRLRTGKPSVPRAYKLVDMWIRST